MDWMDIIEKVPHKLLMFIFYCLNPFVFAILGIYEKLFLSSNESNPVSDWTSEAGVEERKARHKEKVSRVQEQVKAWNTNGRKGHMCSKRPTWKSISVHNIDKSRYTQIELDLEDIVHIDTEKKILTVEPGMNMGRLTSILVPLGWTIPVVPELELLTIGGVICGAGLETSSHKYGLIADTVISHEFVLASGEVITCSETENSDLHYCINLSHGTLGFLTAVQLPLIPATKHVKIEYYATNTVEGVEDLFQQGFREAEFIEGFMYTQNKSVIMLANFTNEEPQPEQVNYINKWYKPWFYKHVEENYANQADTKSDVPVGVEFMETRDYYHRHERGLFWEMAIALPYGNSSWFRYLLGWVYPVNFQLLKKISKEQMSDLFLVKNHVLQDFVVPIPRLKATLDFTHDLVNVYPIWLCPVVFWNKPGRGKPATAPCEMFIDIGIYGNTPKTENFDHMRITKQMEQFVIANKGFQGTYADIYMTREEFMKMFDLMNDYYYTIRKKYGAEDAFPDVYDKICYQARHGGRGRLGLDDNKNPLKVNGHEKKVE